jgi:2-dehydropantoate 2-reductase
LKIAIIGAGAMGTLYGAKLALAGEDVTMIDVVPVAIETMRTEGLLLQLADGEHRAPVAAYLAADVPDTADLVLLFTKAMYSRAALESARGFIGKHTVVMSLQNGLGNRELIEEFIPAARIIIGTSNFPSDLIRIGSVRSIGEGHTAIMNANGSVTPFLQQVCDVFDHAGLNCTIAPDIMTAIWTKVAINATANSITSVCRLRCGVLSTTPEAITLADQIIDEVAAVAKADGAPLNAEAIKENFHRLMAEMSDHLTSTEQDVLNKRPTEVGSINGGVVNKARALGISAPRNETMYLLIRTIEQNYAGQILN